MKRKLKIAVTGGIGGGKSSFCNYLGHQGYPVLSADEISKEILVKNRKIKDEVIKNFGKEIYSNGKLNSSLLAEKVFSNPKLLNKLNSIVHPAVIAEIEKLMKEKLKTFPAIFVEAALIYEARMEGLFDYIILITADDISKQKRLAVKGISGEEFYKRSSSQIPDEKKKKKADFVFENNLGISDLQDKADFFLKIIGLK